MFQSQTKCVVIENSRRSKMKFRDFLTENIKDIPKETQEHLSFKIPMILHQANQAHIFHILTKDYKIHEKLEDFYDQLREQADKIGEVWIGLGGSLTIPELPEFNLDASDENIKEFIQMCQKSNEECLKLTSDIGVLTSVNGYVQEIQEAIQELLYFLR